MSAQDIQAHKEERKEEVAQEKYGASFSELSGKERQSAAGTVGGEIRKEQMSAEHGGDTHEAYAEMGKTGGQARGGSGEDQ
ncbi:MAG: hypothetical protein J3K34DRAFT_415837 [Monoraphidium minutum]|nr:MAG: hypothetical protein J3K34DRAFT_415837 [Monoraphidium minutum]